LKESTSRTSFARVENCVNKWFIYRNHNNKLREVYGNLGFKAGFSKWMKF
jgi:hypothetical protein